MLPEIEDLLSRMACDSADPGPKSVSWRAYREAEKVSDVTWIPHLADEANRSKDKDRRRNIYFILSHIGKNIGDSRVAEILLGCLQYEKHYFVLMFMFDDLSRLPSFDDCRPIVPFLSDKRWQVSGSAMLALRKCTSPECEEFLLQFLPQHTNPAILAPGHSALGAVGTKKSVPYLANMIHHPKDDVKLTAIRALGDLGDSSLTPIYLDALADKSSSVKWMAMRALAKHGDESAIPAVLERTRAIVSKQRKYGQEHKSELEAAIEFLNRFAAQRPEIRALFHQIRTKRWHNVFEDEQQWLREHIPAFADA